MTAEAAAAIGVHTFIGQENNDSLKIICKNSKGQLFRLAFCFGLIMPTSALAS